MFSYLYSFVYLFIEMCNFIIYKYYRKYIIIFLNLYFKYESKTFVDFIKDKIIQYPSLRFYQLLEILGLTEPNKFYEESVETYKKLVDND